ncbi:MAG TPA: AzlD domain-containing protein [Candidatus Binatia bacterium]|jgi:branched-subunit amino acid transport protein
MDSTRLQLIFVMGIVAFLIRAVPQIYFVGRTFPQRGEQFLQYLSYAFICSIVATTLFMSGSHFDSAAVGYRAAALIVTMIVARRTRSAVTGMIVGAIVVSVLARIF